MRHWLSVCSLSCVCLACSDDEGALGHAPPENALEKPRAPLAGDGYLGTVEVMVHDDLDGSVNEHLFLKLDDGGRLQLLLAERAVGELAD